MSKHRSGRADTDGVKAAASVIEPQPFDPDPVALIALFIAAIGTAYQVITYHRPPTSNTLSFYGRRGERLNRQLAEVATDLLGLRSQFEGLQNFLANSATPSLREIQFRYGAGSLTFRDSSQMREYEKQVDRIAKRYSSILHKTVAVISELESQSLRLPPKFVADITTARTLLNSAQFESENIGEAIDKAMTALGIIHDAVSAAQG